MNKYLHFDFENHQTIFSGSGIGGNFLGLGAIMAILIAFFQKKFLNKFLRKGMKQRTTFSENLFYFVCLCQFNRSRCKIHSVQIYYR